MPPLEGSTDDATLVARARRGEAAAFEALVRRHYRPAFATAMALTGTREDAEDVCQDAFLQALERLEDCRQPERVGAWLLQIVRNRAHNHRAWRKVREAEPIEERDAAVEHDPHGALRRDELRLKLEAAIGTLTELQRQVVLLHDLEGMVHKEVAERLDISEVASRQHLFVARRLLRERLGPSTIEEYAHD